MDVNLDILSRQIDNVQINGRICLNIDEHPKKCRELFTELIHMPEWQEKYADKVKTVELPTDFYSPDEENVILDVVTLPSLEFCSLNGGRRGKEGRKCKGGLTSLPMQFKCLSLLRHLNLSFNKFEKIPECVLSLNHLKILVLDYNNVKALPSEISSLTSLEEIYVRNNQLHEISNAVGTLSKLSILKAASNQLYELPDVLHHMKSLTNLDVSNNHITALPMKLLSSTSLQLLCASHNHIESLPDVSQTSCKVIDLRYNYITEVTDEVRRNHRILLQGNVSKINVNNLAGDCSNDDYDVGKYRLDSDINEFDLRSKNGACYTLPSGVQITIPKHFECGVDQIYCNVISKEPTSFKLRPTDQLLSVVLELTPNRLVFEKPIRITLPYTFCGFDQQKREIVIRVTSKSDEGRFKYEDLKSHVDKNMEENNSGCHGEVTADVTHFSLFAAVARLVEDSEIIEQNSPKTIFSSVDPFTKIHFPEDSVCSDTKVTVQILTVSPCEVEEITKLADSHASNVLQVNVAPNSIVFNQPITVHLALPPTLMGKAFDKNELHLMKCPCNSDQWNDITNDVNLVFTTIDVSFQVNAFSKFWLVWSSVCGFTRKVYRRIITYNVQFLAMQKKLLPSLVIAQCVRADQLNERMKQLVDAGYNGEDSCTVIQELMEGDQFKVKVIGDIRLKTYNEADKLHMEEKVLVKRFHSQYLPEKSGFCRFPIEPTSAHSTQTASGYVSFYRIFQPLCHEPADVPAGMGKSTSTKRSLETNGTTYDQNKSDGITSETRTQTQVDEPMCHLDDVLIALEQKDVTLNLPEDKEYSLSFGELGTGMFNESNLYYIASQIGVEWEEIGHYLGLRTGDIDRMKLDNPGQTKKQIFQMLKKWSAMHMHEDHCVNEFTQALEDADRTDLAQKVKKIYKDGAENFRNSIKRRKEITTPENF